MHWILSQKGEIGMKKIYLLLFLCACITSCGRVNENDMKQISNSTQGTQTNKDRIFSIEDRVYTSQKQKSKWWNIHYPKLEGEKTESCNKIILLVLCQDLVQVKMRNFSHFNLPKAQP